MGDSHSAVPATDEMRRATGSINKLVIGWLENAAGMQAGFVEIDCMHCTVEVLF